MIQPDAQHQTCGRCRRPIVLRYSMTWEDRGGFTRCRPDQMLFHRPARN